MTFSVAGFCPRTGMFGVAVSTSSLAVGSRCSWVKAKSGAALIQNYADPSLGPVALEALAKGNNAKATVAHMVAVGHGIAWRQIMVIDKHGATAYHQGEKCLGTHGCAETTHCIAGGDLLADASVPSATIASFNAANPHVHLAERLLLALEGSLAAGHDVRY